MTMGSSPNEAVYIRKGVGFKIAALCVLTFLDSITILVLFSRGTISL
jgi:hypothetical protein